jgi:DNA repair protein SbcC/Rad50
MIMQSIRLHPFAGIVDETYPFIEGLNVICGPNEHGKSTVARAIRHVLFVETNMSRKRYEDAIADVLPVTGGDTIRVTLAFASAGNCYTLEKTWNCNGNGRTQLIVSDGGLVTDPAAVQEILQTLLPANQAVIENILVANQSKLADAINTSPDVHSSLSEKLRSAILNGGGISGTRLQEKINWCVNDYFGRWDKEAGKPEGGTSRESLINRWKSSAGRIVNAWYDWQHALQTEKETEDYETQSNRLQTEQNECNEQLNDVKKFLQMHKAAYEAVNRRIKLESELEHYQNHLSRFATEAHRWPLILAQKAVAENLLLQLNNELASLNEEFTLARQKQDFQRDVDKLRQAEELELQLNKALENCSALIEVPDTDVKAAEKMQKAANSYQAAIDGQRLHLSIDTNVSAQFQLTHSGGITETLNIEPAASVVKEVTGGISFQWHGLTFKVQSANADIAALEESLQQTQNSLQALLRQHGLSTLEELTSCAQRFLESQRQVSMARSNLATFLGGDSLGDLRNHCVVANSLPGTRDSKVLEGLVQEKNKLQVKLQMETDGYSKEISGFEKEHQSLEHLDERRLNGKQAVKEKQEALAILPPLPAGFETALDFQDQYSNMVSEKQRLDDIQHRIELAIKDLKEPVQTLAEAKEATASAEKHFLRMLDEGKAYRRIQQALESILSAADATAFQPLHTKTEAYLQQLSAGRFHSIPFDATQPQKLEGNGVALPVNLLSKGTKDILALSVRLAAADVYLQDRSGFVLMDDPLVDMDRIRREAAAVVLNSFSQQHQTIIFTCHEVHADLLSKIKIAESEALN